MPRDARMDNVDHLLRSWLRPLTVDAFLADYWTRCAYWSAPDAARLQDISQVLPTLDLPHLLEYAAGPIRVWYRDDERPVYGWTLGRRDALHAYRAGLTLYVHLDPAVGRELIATLGRVLRRAPASFHLSIFAGRRGARTLPHVDGRDNFTLQLRGVKRWRISEGREWPGIDEARGAPRAVRDLRRVRRPPTSWDAMPVVEMGPGAFLYCPAAHWHTVEAVDESLSLNVSIDDSHTWADDLLPVIRAALVRHDAWRQPGVGLTSPGAVQRGTRDTIPALLRRLADDLRDLDPGDVLAALESTERTPGASAPSAFARNPFVSCELMSVEEGREFRVGVESLAARGQPRIVTLPWACYSPFLDLMSTNDVQRTDDFSAAGDLVATLLAFGVITEK